jgi:hypothetical protein
LSGYQILVLIDIIFVMRGLCPHLLYGLKFRGINKFQPKRALALTARKRIRPVFWLLKNGCLHVPPERDWPPAEFFPQLFEIRNGRTWVVWHFHSLDAFRQASFLLS